MKNKTYVRQETHTFVSENAIISMIEEIEIKIEYKTIAIDDKVQLHKFKPA